MGIDASAVARGVGVTAKFRDLSGGSVRFVPQRICIIAQGEEGLSYTNDRFTVTSAAEVGAVAGFGSPAYHIANEFFPSNGDNIGTVVCDVCLLDEAAGATGSTAGIEVVAGTATGTAGYAPVIGGIRCPDVAVATGPIDENFVNDAITRSINSVVSVPMTATSTYGSVTVVDGSGFTTVATQDAGGKPYGGDYKLVCTVGGAPGVSKFNLLRPDGTIFATGLADGANQIIDGLDISITSTTAVAGSEATITVEVTDVALASKWKALTANEISVSMEGPSLLGVSFAVTATSGGVGLPSVNNALTQIGLTWVTMICTSESAPSQLNDFQQWGEGRWDELVNQYCVAFYGNTAETVSEATSETDLRAADRVTCQLVAPDSVNMPWVVAAQQVNRISRVAQNNPAKDYGSQPLFSLTPGSDPAQWNYAERDLAIKQGSSTVEKRDGILRCSDIVTPWKPTGQEPPAYRYVRDIVVLMQIAYNLNLAFNNEEWDGAPLIDAGPTVNPDAKTPAMAKAVVAGIVDNLALEALISNPARAKETILAEIDSANPKRLNVSVTVQISGTTNIRDVTLNWGFFFG